MLRGLEIDSLLVLANVPLTCFGLSEPSIRRKIASWILQYSDGSEIGEQQHLTAIVSEFGGASHHSSRP